MNNENQAWKKRKFVQQYVLNRALGNDGGLDGIGASQEAIKAFDYIEKQCPPPPAIEGE